MDLLGLLSGGDLAGANGPDRLVRDDDLTPVGDLRLESLELGADDLDGLAGLALLEGLAAAPDDAGAVLSGVLRLGSDGSVGLVQNGAALRVAKDGPGNLVVLELLDGDLTGEGAVGLVVDVLGGDLETLAKILTDEEKVQGRRSNDNLWEKDLVRNTRQAGMRTQLLPREVYEPTLESRSALLRLATISLMDEMDPFLHIVSILELALERKDRVGCVFSGHGPPGAMEAGLDRHLEVAADEELASHDGGF